MSDAIPLFSLTPSILETQYNDDVEASYKLLHSAGIANQPYPRLALEAPMNALIQSTGRKIETGKEYGVLTAIWKVGCAERAFSVKGVQGDALYFACGAEITDFGAYLVGNGPDTIGRCDDLMLYHECTENLKRTFEAYNYLIGYAFKCLVVALATRQIVEHAVTAYNKRAVRGVGNGRFRSDDRKTIYVSRTVLSIPTETSDGRTIKIHWRRGHVHRYWTGAKNGVSERQLVEKFIKPILVNAATGEPIPAPKNYSFKPQESL